MNAVTNVSRTIVKTVVPTALAALVLFGLVVTGVAVAPDTAGAVCYETKRNSETGKYETFTIDCVTGEPSAADPSPNTPPASTPPANNPLSPGIGIPNVSPPSANVEDTGIHSGDLADLTQGMGAANSSNFLSGGSCGGSASGGSLSNSLAGLLGSSLITCVNGGSSCPGAIQGLVGNAGSGVANALAEKLGVSPSLFGTAISLAQSGNKAQAIINLAGQAVGSKLIGLLGLGNSGGGAAGAAAEAVSGALHSGAGNPIGSLLGGGSAVPTNETNKNLLGDITSTRQSTKALEVKELCTDGIASTLAGEEAARLHAATLTFANEQSIQNWAEFSRTFDESVFKDVVGGITDQDVKQLLIDTYREDTSSKVLQSQNPSAQKSALEQFKCTFVDETCPTLLSEYSDAVNEWVIQRNAAWDAVEQLGITDGLRSQVECLDRNGNPTGETRLELCGGNFRSVTHASVIADERDRSVAAGQEQVANVDEATDNVNQFMIQLFRQAFTNIGGLLSLSERGSAATLPTSTGAGATPGAGVGSGAGTGAGTAETAPIPDNSSYLDQVSNTATDTSIRGAQNFLTANISGAVATEEAYQRTLSGIVADVGTAAGAFDQVRQCYIGLTKRISTGISTTTALERANQASSTIAAIFTPQIERRLGEISNSELVVGELVRIAGLARDAKTADELNAASDSFDALLSAGLVHSETDLIFLENDRTAAIPALDAVADEAFAQLSECRQF